MRTRCVVLVGLVFAGCTPVPEPTVPLLPEPAPMAASGGSAGSSPLVMQEPALPGCPLDRVEVVVVAPLSQSAAKVTFTQKPATKAGPPVSPAAMVADAAKAARVEPSERGYYGGSGEHVYVWMPGKIYTIYLTKTQATALFLPPGEKLVSGLYLDADAYEVSTKRAGAGDAAYDAVVVRPSIDKGDTSAFLLTESGRRYLLRLVTGAVGMLAVTFEGPHAMKQSVPAPSLPLPRNVAAQDPRSVTRPPQDRQ